MEQKYIAEILQYDRIERRVGQFNLDTPEGREEMCEFYEEHNRGHEHPDFVSESDIELFREVAEKYVDGGIEALAQTRLPQKPHAEEKMKEELSRWELLIQSIKERNCDCQAIVPIHLDVLSLRPELRTANFSINDALSTVREWYNKDMAIYLQSLREEGKELPWLRGYEEFGNDWKLGIRPGKKGFLDLTWDEKKSHYIGFGEVPVTLYSESGEHGKFPTAEDCERNGWMLVYRNVMDSEIVAMPPEKLKKYGKEMPGVAEIDLKKGVAEVVAQAFYSPHYPSVAEALLLRNFAVYYHNQLLALAKNNNASI